jgi:hypothetical protein
MPGDMTTIVIIGYRLYHSIVHDSIEIAGIKLFRLPYHPWKVDGQHASGDDYFLSRAFFSGFMGISLVIQRLHNTNEAPKHIPHSGFS